MTENYQGDILICKYMGYKHSRNAECIRVLRHGESTWKYARFNESWDWLMPVVHKILKTELPKKNGWSYEYVQLEATRIGNSVDFVYMKVVEFLKQYNQA